MSTDRQLQWYAHNVDVRGAACVDVGANVGDVSQFFFDHGDEHTRVLSVEPVPANVDALRRRVEAAGADASTRWQVVPAAITDHTGRVTLRARHDDHTGWNAIVSERPPPAEHLEVDGLRLPELAPDANVVKLDVEGHEYRILDDALARLPSVHTWAIELHMVEGRPLPPVLQRFAGVGFEVVAATAKRSAPHGPWHNVAVPATLTWAQIPVAKRRPDGSVFKMLHILARRKSWAGPESEI